MGAGVAWTGWVFNPLPGTKVPGLFCHSEERSDEESLLLCWFTMGLLHKASKLQANRERFFADVPIASGLAQNDKVVQPPSWHFSARDSKTPPQNKQDYPSARLDPRIPELLT